MRNYRKKQELDKNQVRILIILFFYRITFKEKFDQKLIETLIKLPKYELFKFYQTIILIMINT